MTARIVRAGGFAAALLGLWILCVSALAAQDVPGVDMALWQDVANRAEEAVDDPDTENETLEVLRSRLADFREDFNDARSVNSDRIASLRDQLAALGQAPADSADGSTPSQNDAAPEAADVAAQRKELEAQLATLTAPVTRADAAYTRADGLIGEIDSILRARQTEALLEVIESPLNPVYWPQAMAELVYAVEELWDTDRTEEEREAQAELLRKNLPIILLATVAGLVLILRGRKWSTLIVARLRRAETRGLGVWRFVVSLLRIALPFVGLTLLSFAAIRSGYLGSRGDEIATMIPILGGIILGFRWVSEQLFARDEDEALLQLSDSDRRSARWLVSLITVMIIADAILRITLELDEASAAARTVVSFPFTVVMCYALFRIGQLLRRFGAEVVQDEDEEITRASTLARVVRSLGTGALLVAVAAPLLQAAGYENAADFFLFPFIATLIILGLVLALQRFSADVYGAVTGQGSAAREALMPIVFGMVLLMVAAPALALIWGARVSDLTEIWAAFQRGFAIGTTRISPTDFLTFALIFIAGYLLTRLAQGALKTNVLPKTKIDKGGQNAIVSGLGYIGIFLAALLAITGAGIDLSSLAIVAGALSVGIGFGLQNIVSNFVSGIILLIERPISEGDWIEVSGGQMGYVRDISVRSTRIETFDRTDVIVPNADLVSGTVTNYTRGNTLGRVIIPVGVAYGTDTKRVEAILKEIADAQPMALANPAPAVLFLNFGADALEFEIRMFLRDVNWMMPVKSDVNHAIAARFAEEGIEIPFAQRDVWLRNPEVLRQDGGKDTATPATAEPDSQQQTDPSDAARPDTGEMT
ncbi:DUF3772 domain-containing protein [Sulfitobacter sp. HNIBRBA3233]|uniref:DUF3772 domain-containing protein n=1 Tax=Sulfitobacter marinivivus TaxID=3158558 RepID=UPI0032DFD96D